MKKNLIMLISIILLSFCLTACFGVEQQHEESDSEYSMFINVEYTSYYDIVYHEDTKVMYAISRGKDNQGTFTVLLNADGTPMLYEGN